MFVATASGCWAGAAPTRTTTALHEAAPDASEESGGGTDGAGVGTGVAIGVALTVTALVIGGVLFAHSLSETNLGPSEGNLSDGWCASGCH